MVASWTPGPYLGVRKRCELAAAGPELLLGMKKGMGNPIPDSGHLKLNGGKSTSGAG